MSLSPGVADFDYPRTGVILPEYADVTDDWLVDYGAQAAAAGIDSVWCGEGWGYNAFQLLARLADRTECTLGTCIINAFARSPAALAADALTLHDATDGRFILGIGTSTPVVVERFHGVPFERPLRRVRETIEILDLALSGEPIDYDGEVFSLSGFRLNHADGATVPVFNAALGRTNLAMSIDFADGIIPHLFPLTALDDAIAGARERANTDGTLHRSPSLPTSIHPDADRARTVLSKHLAYYLGSTDYYNDVVAANGFADEAHEIKTAWRDRDREAAAAAVTPELQDAIGVVGTPEVARERIEELLADGVVDTALCSFPQGATEEMFDLTLDVLSEVTADG